MVFGGGAGPSFLKQERPVYPPLARKMGKQGRVVLRLSIDENGALTNLEVVEDPGFGFAGAAVSAIRMSTFAPAKREGRAVASLALLPVIFRLGQ